MRLVRMEDKFAERRNHDKNSFAAMSLSKKTAVHGNVRIFV